MQNENVRPLALSLVVLAALARIAQRVNFAPVGALSLYAGGRLRGWQAYAMPLVLMAVTDPLLGGYSFATPFIYTSFLIYVWIGTRLRSTENPLWITAAAIGGSVQFFLITNFATWLSGQLPYSRDFAGLMQCYAAALPFFRHTAVSDLMYSAILFGLHAVLSRTVARAERVIPAPAV